ncbi:fasciclin domain-containing protein [Methanoculleus sp. FWC-SCC1]|uniref:Fasciclin domain-containing protein n=1 Tax=Methanoculleus frigidifontis TaxID=2584085 RepID=A0ABT8MDH3_9EURY|nr:fasciclin domain-containing protein [Methanoculleus sp. FWC-SCC1]MDN7025990.1 fasciclin domain-containing protein [Methanoculleus sp. FWC-SCC1]
MANIFETLKNDGRFGKFLEVVQSIDKEEMLKSAGPMTLIVPVDSAWDEIPEPNRSMILNDKQMLWHLFDFMQIGEHKYSIDDLAEKKIIQTVEGVNLEVMKTDEGYQIETGKVIDQDIGADNGIIHVIDKVPFATLSQAYEAYAKTGQ